MEQKKLTLTHIIYVVLIVALSCAAAVFLNAANQSDSELSTNNQKNIRTDQNERTFIMLKPDTVQRGLIGKIIQRFEEKGLKLVALKFVWASKEQVEEHYKESINREHYQRLIEFMISGPVVPMVWEGLNAVKIGRQMMGSSNPIGSMPGSIRADFSIDRERSIIHGSDTLEAAKREIHLWFQEDELIPWSPANLYWIYV